MSPRAYMRIGGYSLIAAPALFFSGNAELAVSWAFACGALFGKGYGLWEASHDH